MPRLVATTSASARTTFVCTHFARTNLQSQEENFCHGKTILGTGWNFLSRREKCMYQEWNSCQRHLWIREEKKMFACSKSYPPLSSRFRWNNYLECQDTTKQNILSHPGCHCDGLQPVQPSFTAYRPLLLCFFKQFMKKTSNSGCGRQPIQNPIFFAWISTLINCINEHHCHARVTHRWFDRGWWFFACK